MALRPTESAVAPRVRARGAVVGNHIADHHGAGHHVVDHHIAAHHFVDHHVVIDDDEHQHHSATSLTDPRRAAPVHPGNERDDDRPLTSWRHLHDPAAVFAALGVDDLDYRPTEWRRRARHNNDLEVVDDDALSAPTGRRRRIPYDSSVGEGR